MAERPRFLDDLAGMAGGALSIVAGLRQEAEALARTAVDDALRRLDLVRREELDALSDQLAKARTGQEESASAASDLMARLAVLEARVAALEARENDSGN
jgi:BMFP domain-containing protein YqiC